MFGAFFEALENRVFLSAATGAANPPEALHPAAVVRAAAKADKTPPTATAVAASVTTAGGTVYSFTVTYSDPSKVKRSSVGAGGITVTGPNGYKAVAKFVSATPAANATSVKATYSIVPPTGHWTSAANGTYTITLNAKHVSDALGNINPTARTISTFVVNIATVNQAPSFTKGADQSVNQDAGAQTVTNWATNVSPGPANESGQTLTFLVSTDNSALFAAAPAIGPTGTLTYTPAAGMTGVAQVTVRLKDNGGTANGGVDTSPAQTFAIHVVNAGGPGFTKGPDQVVNEDAGAQTAANWATNISAGTGGGTPAFSLTTDNNALFAVAPAIAADGTLSYTPAPASFGVAHVTVQLQGSGSAAVAAFTITVNPVNHAPSFTGGASQVVNEGAGSQTVSNWAKNISAGPANESGQTLTFLVSTDNNSLFAVAPAIGPTGTLTYTPAAFASGVAHVTVQLKDSGGTANGGVDTSAAQTFTITVNAVNQAPSFSKGADQSVVKGTGAQTVTNWATNISAGPANESGQTVTFLVSSDNSALFSAGPSISPNGTLTYTPAPGASGVAHVTVRLKDNGGTANGGVDTSAAQTFTINVTVPVQIPSLLGTYNGSLIIPAVGHYRSAVLNITQQSANGSYSGTLVGDNVVSVNVSGVVSANRTFTMTVVTPPNTNHPGGPIYGTGTGTIDSTGAQIHVDLTFSAYGTTFPGTVDVTKA
ncbi:MAG: hypothetical protein ACHRHE_10855 [Tepidisphaerales bacterium]